MRVQSILNRIERYKGFVYESVRWSGKAEAPVLQVQIRPRAHTPPRCSGCGERGPGYDTLAPRQVEFVPLWGIRVFFLYALRRVQCQRCGVKVEAVPWAAGKRTLTHRYRQFLGTWAGRLAWQEVARFFQTSWEQVYRSVSWMVEWGLAHRDLAGIRALGLDEVAFQRGHGYLTVVYQIDAHCKRLLWVGRERRRRSLEQFFEAFGRQRSGQLRWIVSDLWKPYLQGVAQRAPRALHLLDRFHVAWNLNKAIDQVRAQEAQELRRQGMEAVLKRSRWCLLKRPQRLTGWQGVKLAELLRYNLRTVRAYLLKEDFEFFWDCLGVWSGRRFLTGWFHRALRSRLAPMKRVARTLHTHRSLLLNWFRARPQLSLGATEGLNNRLKLTLRKAYGFRTFRAAEMALYHTLGALPRPPSTHRFC